MEFMKSLPDKAYDLAIVDPPYGIGRDSYTSGSKPYLGRGRKGTWRNPTPKIYNGSWDIRPTDEYFTELKRVSENQIIWGGNFFCVVPSPCWIVWDKQNANTTMADCELAWTSFKTAVRKFTWMWSGFYQQLKEERIHPTQKPVALYQWLLKNYAKQGDKILDTHGGSCSIAIACDIMGFDLDVCELDTDYYNAAVERFERHKRQGVLQFD
jgi:site-specific DNA-methyltransferase (adenine-specific)